MTVLSESAQRILTPFGCGLIIFGFVALLICIITICSVDDAVVFTVMLVVLVVSVVPLIAGICVFNKPHRKVKATISEDYPAVSLYDKYNVEERDGDIWILVEKEPMKKEGEGG